MKTILMRRVLHSGFVIGESCALVSLVLFCVANSARMAVTFGDSFGHEFSFNFTLIIVVGGIFAFVPAGLGGLALELLLRSQLKKSPLTAARAAVAGALVAGLAASITCGMGLLVLRLVPHGYWRYFLDDVVKAVLFGSFLVFLDSQMEFVARYLPEIITAVILACLSGGFAGRYLASVLSASPTGTS